MQWHLFWRKSNLGGCRAWTAAVSGYGIQLVKREPFESKAFRAESPIHKTMNVAGCFSPFLPLWQSDTCSLTLAWWVSVSKPLLLLRCTKAWYGWSTFRSLQHVLQTDPGWQGSGQMSVFMLSTPQLNGLQPQTSLSALYQFHYMVILPPQHSAGNV